MNCTDHDMACFIPKESNAVSVDVSYNASLTSDITAFEQSLNNVYARQESSPQTISNDVGEKLAKAVLTPLHTCLLYTSPSPRDQRGSRMPSSA